MCHDSISHQICDLIQITDFYKLDCSQEEDILMQGGAYWRQHHYHTPLRLKTLSLCHQPNLPSIHICIGTSNKTLPEKPCAEFLVIIITLLLQPLFVHVTFIFPS